MSVPVTSATGAGAPTTAEVPAKKAVASVAKLRKCIVDEWRSTELRKPLKSGMLFAEDASALL